MSMISLMYIVDNVQLDVNQCTLVALYKTNDIIMVHLAKRLSPQPFPPVSLACSLQVLLTMSKFRNSVPQGP